MAAAKKKKKEKSSNPNIVLIIFVVFLFLVTIGLGIWVYYEHDNQKKLLGDAYTARKALEAEKVAVAYNSMLAREFRMALGDSLKEEEMAVLDTDRGEFSKDNFGRFKDEKNKEVDKKLLEDLKARLGVAEDNKTLKASYDKLLKAAEDKAKAAEGVKAAALAKIEFLEKFTGELRKKQDEFQQKASERIQKGADDASNANKQQSDGFVKLAESLRELNNELKVKGELLSDQEVEFKNQLRKLEAKLKILEAERNEKGVGGGGPAVVQGPVNNTQPLVLTCSTGKPLWDQAVGKITRVDPELRQVTINLGHAQGVKTELTFTVFSGDTGGRAEKQMKGSIEVIRVVDANTSLARITSLYDLDGREIQLNDPAQGRVLRESEAALRAGDLLFNMFWGTRVAIAGYVSITGDPSDNPAEQVRQMDDFMYYLKRHGMQVDAFIDLRDGKILGNLSSKTRYLILGDQLKGAPEAPAPMVAKEKEGEEKEAKEKEAPKEQPGDERAKAVKDARDILTRDAAQKGLLAISAENFATVIGYRRARNANQVDLSDFRPALPYAGVGAVVEARPRVPDEAEKKEPKMEEKKEKADN